MTVSLRTAGWWMLVSTWLLLGACSAHTTTSPPTSPATAAAPVPSRILFVGNSFTYYNDSLHNHLRKLIDAGNPGLANKPRLRSMTVSGARLVEHSAAFESIVSSEPWDVVVLQGHSREAFDEPTRPVFRQTVRGFDRIVREAGARTALFMTWAYEDRADMTAVIANEYSSLGMQLGALVIPVGLAFERVTQDHPGIALRQPDARHPTLAGTYLAACVFYARLYQMTPVGNPYVASLDPVTARRLQEAAWQTVTCKGGCGSAHLRTDFP